MKRYLSTFIALLAASDGLASDRYPKGGQPFQAENIEIVWNAPTNHLPAALWVYKEVRAEFSRAVISNVIALGSFKESDKKKTPGPGYTIQDKKAQYFRNKDESRRLDIIPTIGAIEYRDNRASVSSSKERVTGIPSIPEAVDLALQHLERLEISRTNLSRRADGSRIKWRHSIGERGWMDKSSGRMIKETNRIGMNFIRQLDGVDFAGGWNSGGFSIDFGNNSQVAHLSLSWRNLQRHRQYPVASTEAITKRVKRGEATLFGAPLNPAEIKRLLINSATPFYWGAYGHERQEFVYPFVELQCLVELSGNTNSASVVLNCPILME